MHKIALAMLVLVSSWSLHSQTDGKTTNDTTTQNAANADGRKKKTDSKHDRKKCSDPKGMVIPCTDPSPTPTPTPKKRDYI